MPLKTLCPSPASSYPLCPSSVSSGRPEDPLHRGPGTAGQRQVPGRAHQRQVRPVRSHQGWVAALQEQGHPRDRQPEVERSV